MNERTNGGAPRSLLDHARVIRDGEAPTSRTTRRLAGFAVHVSEQIKHLLAPHHDDCPARDLVASPFDGAVALPLATDKTDAPSPASAPPPTPRCICGAGERNQRVVEMAAYLASVDLGDVVDAAKAAVEARRS